jgi:hypothetical protein
MMPNAPPAHIHHIFTNSLQFLTHECKYYFVCLLSSKEKHALPTLISKI